jgi:UDP-galactopyranose mutase
MKINNYDIIIVGSGFAGSVTAYLAAKRGKRVLLLERRKHIAGNMYDETDSETGLLVQKYGPHSFHTDCEEVYNFVTSIGEWFPFTLTASVEMLGKFTPSPFNFTTIDDYFEHEKAHKLKKLLANKYNYSPKVTIVELLQSDEPLIKEYAEFLFENDYRPYTIKQWNIKPEELDKSVLQRVPVRLDYTNRYFDDRYQMLPEGGFTEFFRTMLSNPLIDIALETDALKLLTFDNKTIQFDGEKLQIPLVYTGAADELFGCKFGKLPYRSLRFEYKTLNTDSFQNAPGVAYPKADGFTRITEYSKLPPQKTNGKTIIAYEYPTTYSGNNEPYYPVLTAESAALYKRYATLAAEFDNLYLCGRLADFKYYNMDAVILRAIRVYNSIENKEWKL